MAIDEKALERAIIHLVAFGDTDIFPQPFEISFYSDCQKDITKKLSNIDASTHAPTSAFECLSPKGNLSFRIAHQLYPLDTLLYTAATIQIAPALEKLKAPTEKGPFAYRFIEDDDEPHLFNRNSSYHDWLLHLKEIFREDEAFADLKYVIETDISDFYSRIYFHRIEHVLDDCGAPNQIRKIIENIIKSARAKQSYGLPVGTSASRILAEALLVDTDTMICDRSVAYSRYVDDFRIVVERQSEVHGLLCNLAEHLMLTEGLALNANKTRSYTNVDGINHVDKKMSDVFTDDELIKLNHYISVVYDDEEVSVEDLEDVDPENLIAKLAEALDGKHMDYTAIKVILKVLRAVPIEDPVKFSKKFIELLYHTPRDFCLLVGGLAQRNPADAEAIAGLLVETIGTAPFKDMALSRIWVSHLFVTQALPVTSSIREKLNLSQSVIERRNDLILRGILSDRAFFRAQKTKFDEANNWEKPALMLGASCLSKSEYGTWLDNTKDHINDPLVDLYVRWLKNNQEDIFDRIKYDYVIKNRAERLAELFASLQGGLNLGIVSKT